MRRLGWMRMLALVAVAAGPVCGPLWGSGRATALAPGSENRDEGPAMRVAQSLEAPFRVASHGVTDVDGDGRDDLLLVGRDGEVRTWHVDPRTGAFEEAPRGTLALPDPAESVYALGDVLGTDRRQLVVASPAGIVAYPVEDGGTFASVGERVSRRARFEIRVGAPVPADIVADVNGDGRDDLVLPTASSLDLWMAEGRGGDDGGSGAPTFRRAASLAVGISRDRETAVDAVTDRLHSSFTIPRLRIEDVSGDGRADLVLERGNLRSFHLQRDDGSIPPAPDVTVDVEIFRDTTPEAKIRLGETLAGSDDSRFFMQDLDADGIPDYVIAHRRKVWVFHGTSEGPQFTRPTSILKVAEDISALLVVRLDADPRPDLLLLKIRLPGVATLLRGLVTEWDVDLTATAYPGAEDPPFEPTPRWKSDLTLRLPSILSLLRRPEVFLERIDEAARKFRASAEADLDGRAPRDVALVSEDGEWLDVWLAREGDPEADDSGDLGPVLRKILFEDENRVWNLDRVLNLIAGFGAERTAALTGERDADLRAALRDSADLEGCSLDPGDVDGDGRAELLVAYRRHRDGALVIDVLAVQ